MFAENVNASVGDISPESLAALFGSLTPDSKRAFVYQYLLPLVGPSSSAASALQSLCTAHAGMPALGRMSRATMLEQLRREMGRTLDGRGDILDEIVMTLVRWIEDIWSVVMEYQTDFEEAHNCLLLVADVVVGVCGACISPSGCRCFVMNATLDVSITRRKTHQTVKTFQLDGLPGFRSVLLWVWRDLFVAMLAHGSREDAIPRMLDEIREATDWRALVDMLYGARSLDEDGEFIDDEDDMEEFDFLAGYDCPNGYHCHRTCPFHPPHWSLALDDAMDSLRNIVTESLLCTFARAPAAPLFRAIIAITTNTSSRTLMLSSLHNMALTSPGAFVAALEIHADEGDTHELWRLLDSGRHLLRPRDARVLQLMTFTLSHDTSSQSRARVQELIKRELLDSARCIIAALLPTFGQLYDPASAELLRRALAHPPGRLARENALGDWIKAVSTQGNPGAGAGFAAQMAALAGMMGIAVPLDEAEGAVEAMGIPSNLTREEEEEVEGIKARFDGWIICAEGVGRMGAILIAVARELRSEVKWIEEEDFIEALGKKYSFLLPAGQDLIQVHRLDVRGRETVVDALDALRTFVRAQRRKEDEARQRQARKTAKEARAKEAKTKGKRKASANEDAKAGTSKDAAKSKDGQKSKNGASKLKDSKGKGKASASPAPPRQRPVKSGLYCPLTPRSAFGEPRSLQSRESECASTSPGESDEPEHLAATLRQPLKHATGRPFSAQL
ncbi:hypothetical protein K488DRAFT_72688 [Vararia minispora EC-137]|uniref:Uncharacterized protein n=1 Tax=Vararia minispora EC-137 TaxID=1314806 RepID=A0ACB8QES9_9AGAM|nr:hypothetical protein K488DRAFT_72688 [Vararia minispora EC-137]